MSLETNHMVMEAVSRVGHMVFDLLYGNNKSLLTKEAQRYDAIDKARRIFNQLSLREIQKIANDYSFCKDVVLRKIDHLS